MEGFADASPLWGEGGKGVDESDGKVNL